MRKLWPGCSHVSPFRKNNVDIEKVTQPWLVSHPARFAHSWPLNTTGLNCESTNFFLINVMVALPIPGFHILGFPISGFNQPRIKKSISSFLTTYQKPCFLADGGWLHQCKEPTVESKVTPGFLIMQGCKGGRPYSPPILFNSQLCIIPSAWLFIYTLCMPVRLH